MIKLRLRGNVLYIEGDKTHPIFGWQHRMFFTILNECQWDEQASQYIFSDRLHLRDTLDDIVAYLRQEGWQFTADQHVTKFINQLEDEQTDYNQALQEDHATSPIVEPLSQATPSRGLTRQLKAYQQQGLTHLLRVKHGANFSVPGSGKTTVIYAAWDKLRRHEEVEKLLVIGPRSSFLPWEEEAIACFGQALPTARLTGSQRKRFYSESSNYDVFLATYQTVVNDLSELMDLCQRHRVFVVIDESHNIKRLEGGVWAEAVLELAPFAKRRAVLSGTPMPNGYGDLWTQITFLWPGKQVLGDRVSYRHRHRDTNGTSSIRDSIRPFIFRVTKSELDLPKPEFRVHECELSRYQAHIYNALAAKYVKELDIQPHEQQMLRQWRKAKIVRLLQTASNPTLLSQYSEEFAVPAFSGDNVLITNLIDNYPMYEVPTKITLALKLVRDLMREGEKVVVWTSFIHNIQMLMKLLTDVELFTVYGAVPRDDSEDVEFNREQQIRDFKGLQQPAVLLANPAACAESISLHRECRQAIYLDRTFNCGQYLQSLDRIHRIGLEQDDKVVYHILLARNTIDETIDRRLREKEATMLHLLEGNLPLGTFEVEEHEMQQSEDEQALDFQETMRDLTLQLATHLQSPT